jgi:hypothetical protein
MASLIVDIGWAVKKGLATKGEQKRPFCMVDEGNAAG